MKLITAVALFTVTFVSGGTAALRTAHRPAPLPPTIEAAVVKAKDGAFLMNRPSDVFADRFDAVLPSPSVLATNSEPSDAPIEEPASPAIVPPLTIRHSQHAPARVQERRPAPRHIASARGGLPDPNTVRRLLTR